MQIKYVEINNYRSLKKVAVSSLEKINMLFGYNNTGKSNFLRFIDLVFRRKSKTNIVVYMDTEGKRIEDRSTVEPRGWWEGEFRDIAYMFTDDKREEEINFSIVMGVEHSELGDLQKILSTDFLSSTHNVAHICFEGIIRSVNYDEAEISLIKVTINKKIAFNLSIEEKTEHYFPSSKSLIGKKETFYSLLAIFNDCVLLLGSDRYLIKERELSNVIGNLNAQNTKNWLFDLNMDSQKYTKFCEFIKFIKGYQTEHITEDTAKNAWLQWPFHAGEIGFARFGENIEIMLRNAKDRFPLSSYGTGVQQILYILARLFFTSSHIVLIEEIELNLSPTAQRELFINFKRLMDEKQLDQLLFTTHSNYFNYRGDFRIYEAVLDKNGYTSINQSRPTGTSFFRRTLIN